MNQVRYDTLRVGELPGHAHAPAAESQIGRGLNDDTSCIPIVHRMIPLSLAARNARRIGYTPDT